MNSETFNHADRSGFVERLGRLSGTTTWREPGGSGYTPPTPGALSTENAMLLSLAMARKNPKDVGPDVAYSVGTGQPYRRQRVIEWLADKLQTGTGAAGHKAKRQLLSISGQAYDLVIGTRERVIPPRGAVAEYTLLVNVGAGWLWVAMESAVERAETALYSRQSGTEKDGACVSRG